MEGVGIGRLMSTPSTGSATTARKSPTKRGGSLYPSVRGQILVSVEAVFLPTPWNVIAFLFFLWAMRRASRAMRPPRVQEYIAGKAASIADDTREIRRRLEDKS